MPKVGSMVSTPAGEAKVNSVNVMKKTVTLWMTEQKQVVEMPAVDLQMQYGLTVRPVELVREIEDPLRHESPSAEAPALGMPSDEGGVAPPPAGEGETSEGDAGTGEQTRRRRGRRGGRGRRRPGGPPSPASGA
jgi:hypothetical protein